MIGRPSRREWISAAAGGALSFDAPARRPNVVLVMTDDQGYGDLSCHGNPYLRTPNIDGLANQGIEFRRFYVSPVCAPTRSSLLTGRYNLHCGVYGVTRGFETMRTEEVTIAEALRGAGYRTALCGKWHLGEHYPYVPHAQGFDEFVGFRTGHWLNYFDPPLERNGRPIRGRGFITEVFTDEAIAFMERNRARPFFLYVAYNAPHSPYQVPDRNFERFRNNKDLSPETAVVYGMVENVDENVGRLLRSADELGLARDTIFIFLTDNGPNGQRFNAGLRGAKGSVYEGGVRVPFFIRWPGRLKPGHRVDTMAAHIDVYPTLLDLCGVARPEGPPIDGVSLRPLLEKEESAWPDRMLFTHREGAGDPSSVYPGTVRTQQFNLVNGKELYEIPSDPGEKNNVAGAHPEIVKRLRAGYEKWFTQAARECGFTRKPIPAGYAEENPVVLPATQSYFNGQLRFHNESGYAHDWIDNWTRTGDFVYWEIDVAKPGEYEATLAYACADPGAGIQVSVTAGDAQWAGKVQSRTPMDLLPNHNRIDNTHYIDLAWGSLSLGRAKLGQGKTRIAVKLLSSPGPAGLQVKSLSLRRS